MRGELVPGDVEVEDGVIVDVGLPGGARGRIAVPGFVDLQVNGFGGVDFLSASTEDYDRAGEALLLRAASPRISRRSSRRRRAAMLDALRAMPAERRRRRASSARTSRGRSSRPSGSARIRASTGAIPISRCSTGCSMPGRVTEMTLAPELPGADALIQRLLERGVVVSAGHTNATAAQAHAASTSASRRLRTSSTRCVRSARATPASSASR